MSKKRATTLACASEEELQALMGKARGQSTSRGLRVFDKHFASIIGSPDDEANLTDLNIALFITSIWNTSKTK